MSTGGKSRKRSGNSNGKRATAKSPEAIDRPFDPAIWRKAKKIAMTYRLVIEPEPDVGYVGRTVEMPYVMADGETIESCVAETIDATTATVATYLERGERPPAAASSSKRDHQVNIRLSADEKFRLEEAARRAGFRSVSDFIRAASLDRAG